VSEVALKGLLGRKLRTILTAVAIVLVAMTLLKPKEEAR